MPMLCVDCGSSRPDGASVCPTCGKPMVVLNAVRMSAAAGAVQESPGDIVLTAPPAVGLFNVGTPKLVLMSISTFNFYCVYWLYKNWVAERELSGEAIVPWARALFSVIFIYSLARRVIDR